jgi:pimeloyl-ACP methyl ester carboxylesterase
MLQSLFHNWERRLAAATTDRVVRPFDWGLDWIPENGHHTTAAPADRLGHWISEVMVDSDAFFTPPPTTDYTLTSNWGLPSEARSAKEGDLLTFPSAFTTPHHENNTVYARYFPARLKPSRSGSTADRNANASAERRSTAAGPAAVLVLPQWNSTADGHIGLSKLLAWSGMSALRLSLPYHDWRMPPELHRADYIVSANVARTVQVCRQAVLDARRAIAWLAARGYERIGILGSSLGSCLALLTTAHEPLIRVEALNHISPHFADVVWRGLSTRHVREGLDGHIELDLLRTLWRPISPRWYLERLRDRKTLLVYARYDLTFPPDLSQDLVAAFRELRIPHEVATLRCGHYTTGKAPFKFIDGWLLTRFLKRALAV